MQSMPVYIMYISDTSYSQILRIQTNAIMFKFKEIVHISLINVNQERERECVRACMCVCVCARARARTCVRAWMRAEAQARTNICVCHKPDSLLAAKPWQLLTSLTSVSLTPSFRNHLSVAVYFPLLPSFALTESGMRNSNGSAETPQPI